MTVNVVVGIHLSLKQSQPSHQCGYNFNLVSKYHKTLNSGTHRPNRVDVWSFWGNSDEFRNKSVRCVQLRWKLLEPYRCCLLWFNMRSLRRLAVGRLSHWILWLCVSCMTILIGGVLANKRSVWEGWNAVCAVLCTLFHHFLFSCSATRLLHLAQAQNVHATVELAARWSGVCNATFLTNGSNKRQQSGWMKAVGCWFQSGWCVGAFKIKS